MLVRDTDDNIKDYYTQVKDKYPNLTLRDFEKICKAPFSFFRKAIESGNFQTIAVKFFGKFAPFRNFKDKRNEEAKDAFDEQE